jgi:hypothetical protein
MIDPRIAACVALAFAAGAAAPLACTPEQRAPVRTALEMSQCINAIAVRHIDAGDDFQNAEMLAKIASEIAVECNPLARIPE